jgi:hypothetical protein
LQAVIALGASVLVAAIAPATRAMRIHPMIASWSE